MLRGTLIAMALLTVTSRGLAETSSPNLPPVPMSNEGLTSEPVPAETQMPADQQQDVRLSDDAVANPVGPAQGLFARRIRLSDNVTIDSPGITVPSSPVPDQLHRLAHDNLDSECRRGQPWACAELGVRARAGWSTLALKSLSRACDHGSAPGCHNLIDIDEALPFGNGARVTGGVFLFVGGGLAALGLLFYAGSGPADEAMGGAAMVLGGAAASTGALIYLIGAYKGSHSRWRDEHPRRSSLPPMRGAGMRVSF